MHCVGDQSCASVNFKTSGTDKGLCELNSKTLREISYADGRMYNPKFNHLYKVKKRPADPIQTQETQRQATGQCKETALGMENMKISDSKITASTEYSGKHSARKARLNGPDSWVAKQNDSDPWIEVDLGRNETITAIAIQGQWRWVQWVKTFTVSYSSSGKKFDFYKINGSYCKSRDVAFGMQNGKIHNLQLNSSSVYQNKMMYSPKNGRLHGENSWRAKTNDDKQWIQVDFSGEEIVTGIASQGDEKSEDWVKSYLVSYSLDGINYKNYTIGGVHKVFHGNEDQISVVTNVLSPAITARYIRINPVSWFNNISMRIEVFGCYAGPCTGSEVPLGVENERIKDSQMSSSTAQNRFPASDGRLNSRRAGAYEFLNYGRSWRPKDYNQGQWLQVDLGKKEIVTAIATQGYGTGYWVKTYSMSYGLDEENLTSYRMNTTQKVFDGNTDENSVVTNVLSPAVTARYIRIHPKTWNNVISLRVELYGCPRVNPILCKAGERALGVEVREKVKDSQLTSSSDLKKSFSAAYGRLYNRSAVWRAGINDKNQWLQVDLGKKEVVSGIATQGGYYYYQGSCCRYCWVETYFVEYRLNGTTLESYKDGGVDKIFIGNSDNSDIVKNDLSPPITARYIRIHPVSWGYSICMGIELYSCY
ncbi:uncharacterized protein LOC114537501 [Dendronephthya gigantea]|uniref:uncharacterized protein LOC114537501 n=1 Tax=Dendronephthya gigantea TaxID=151771 RepID=UPI00106CD2E9|nr:uncharacterized protein LOC114537501 [Dendronephthya gigantea]